MDNFEDYDREWREACRIVLADFHGLLGFRQFKLSPSADVDPSDLAKLAHPRFEDDFTLRSFYGRENWKPRGNRAHCIRNIVPHPIASRTCTCGYYASYSSSIIYDPSKLGHKQYCFAAVTLYGENLPPAQNGLRSTGADVAGILFSQSSRHLPSVQSFMRRLVKEGIYHTFSASAFIKKFPDQSYEDVIGFDPVQRIAERRVEIFEHLPRNQPPGHWRTVDYSDKFCRILRPEMLDRIEVPAKDTDKLKSYEVFIKPEYRPGGRLYRHPLLEVWGN